MSIFTQYDFSSSPSTTSSVRVPLNSIIGFSIDEDDFMSYASTVSPQNYSINFLKNGSSIPLKIELGKTHMYETDDFINDEGDLIIAANPPKSLKINIITFTEGGND